MISILLGANPITASVITNTVSNSFAFSGLAGAIRMFAPPFSTFRRLTICSASPSLCLLVPYVFGRSVKVKWFNS